MPYESVLARYYDDFMRDTPYEAWVSFMLSIANRHEKSPGLILDLGCGTGTADILLAKMGYEVIGVDSAEDMLAAAQQKAYELPQDMRPLFLHQDMRELDLYGTVDTVLCLLDGVNYIAKREDLVRVFSRAALFMNPGGILIFDINTKRKFSRIHERAFVCETEGAFLIWQAEYDNETRLCRFDFDIFEQNAGGAYRRYKEEHFEYAYSEAELREILEDSGLHYLSTSPAPYGFVDSPEDRIFIAAEKRAE